VTFAEHLRSVLSVIETTLLEKNDRYGNSALDPIRIFSRADRSAGIAVRIDDKLSRIRNLGTAPSPDEDTVRDLLGYLVLWCVAEEMGKAKPEISIKVDSSVAEAALEQCQAELDVVRMSTSTFAAGQQIASAIRSGRLTRKVADAIIRAAFSADRTTADATPSKHCGAEFFTDDLDLRECTDVFAHTGLHSFLPGVTR